MDGIVWPLLYAAATLSFAISTAPISKIERCVMKCIAVSALAVAVTLAGWTPGVAKDEEYVKVEIKGRFKLCRLNPGRIDPAVVSNGHEYLLDFSRPAGKAISEKRLKELNDEFVIVEGHLVLHRDPNFWIGVAVSKISLAPMKKDK